MIGVYDVAVVAAPANVAALRNNLPFDESAFALAAVVFRAAAL